MLCRFTPGCAAVVVAIGLSGADVARAMDGIDPRQPVIWEPTPACMTLVDRSNDPNVSFVYTLVAEDLRPGNAIHEVEDSRRHQFIAFCQATSPQDPLPVWLSLADVMAAADIELLMPEDVKSEDILESNPDWSGCFTRITEDDERRLITFAAASEPVVWDTTGVPAGAYVVAGYTWQPVFNTWSKRSGVVKIVDDPDPAVNGPAAAISTGSVPPSAGGEDTIIYSDDMLLLTGCVDALYGTTMTGYWAKTQGVTGTELEWEPFASDVPVTGETFELPFSPPVSGTSVAIKIDFEDPMDRRYTAHMLTLIDILPGSAPAECDDDGNDSVGFIDSAATCNGSGDDDDDDTDDPTMPTEASSDPSSSPTGDNSTGDNATGDTPTTETADGEGAGGGCGCDHGHRSGLWLLVLALVAGWRRRSPARIHTARGAA